MAKICVQVPSFSILTIIYPNEQFKYVGYLESVLTIGGGIGPVLGSILYYFFGYFYTFLIVGLSVLVFTPLIYLFKPSNIDDEDELIGLTQNQHSDSANLVSQISFCKLISN